MATVLSPPAAAAAGGGGGASLAASYAALQSSLRKQFYGDLVDLRGALLNTMSMAPHRAASLHPKMSLIDAALTMIEEAKPAVSHADMAELLNMSAKVARAVEAWRSRKLPPLGAGMGGPGAASSAVTSPFGTPEVQGVAHTSGNPTAAAAAAAAAGLRGAGGGSSAREDPASAGQRGLDRFDLMSRLVAGQQAAALRRNSASLLPDIDWEVPEIKPSGGLDALLAAEAQQAQQQQQRAAAQASKAARMSTAEVFLAQFSARADLAALPSGNPLLPEPSPHAAGSQHLQQLYMRGGMSPLHDPGAGAGLAGPAGGALQGFGGRASPRSTTTANSAAAAALALQPQPPMQQQQQQQQASINYSGGTLSAGGTASPAPALQGVQQQQTRVNPPGSAYAAAEQGRFGALMPTRSQQLQAALAAQALSLDASPAAAAWGNLLPPAGSGFATLAQQQQQPQQTAAAALQQAAGPGSGFGDATSLPLSQSSRGSRRPQASTAAGAPLGMQQLAAGMPDSTPPAVSAAHAQLEHPSLQQQAAGWHAALLLASGQNGGYAGQLFEQPQAVPSRLRSPADCAQLAPLQPHQLPGRPTSSGGAYPAGLMGSSFALSGLTITAGGQDVLAAPRGQHQGYGVDAGVGLHLHPTASGWPSGEHIGTERSSGSMGSPPGSQKRKRG